MNHAFITGFNGFAGSYLTEHLLEKGWKITGLDRRGVVKHPLLQKSQVFHEAVQSGQMSIVEGDIIQVDEFLSQTGPESYTHIFHLAGLAFVPDSWKNPGYAFQVHAQATADLLSRFLDRGFAGRFLLISSSDVYGGISNPDRPILESDPLNPESPYAISKESAEKITALLCKNRAQAIVARPFNHTGPYQNSDFVVPAFIHRIHQAVRENRKEIATGDLKSARDFSDVRDVIRAYTLIATNGKGGEVYNVCSGKPTTIQEILQTAMEISEANLDVTVDPNLLRPEGTTVRFGSSDKIRDLGWVPEFSIRTTISDIHQQILSREKDRS